MASQSAIAAVEASGGSLRTVYHGRVALRAHLKPELFAVVPKNPAPPPRLMPYYTDLKNRGYLSSDLQLAHLMRVSPVAAAASASGSGSAGRVSDGAVLSAARVE